MSETDSHSNTRQPNNRQTHESAKDNHSSDQERPKRRPRRRRRRPQGQQSTATTDAKQGAADVNVKKAPTTDHAKKPRRRRSNHRKPVEGAKKTTQGAAKSQVAAPTTTGSESVALSQATLSTTRNETSAHTSSSAVAKSASQIRDDLALAFVGHDPQPLQPVARQAVFVFIRNLRQVRQLKRFGDIDYVSKKMHYVVIYMDQAQIESQRQALNKLNFVKRVVVSERPAVDPFVGQGVNANFVTHTKGDGGADALATTDNGEV